MNDSNKTENGRGGKRPGAGRPPRIGRKARAIWCGQHSDEDRALILTLTPDERHAALMVAVFVKLDIMEKGEG